MPQCICCVQVNRSPKYTTDRLETKQYTQLSKLLAYTQNKQSLKVTSDRHINAPVRLLCTGKQVTQGYNLYTIGSFQRHEKGPPPPSLLSPLSFFGSVLTA